MRVVFRFYAVYSQGLGDRADFSTSKIGRRVDLRRRYQHSCRYLRKGWSWVGARGTALWVRARSTALWVGVVVVLSMVIVTGCQSPVTQREHAERYPLFDAMRGELGPFQYGKEVDAPRTRRYYRKCVVGLPDAYHQPGFFEFDGVAMAVHAFYPTFPRTESESGTVIVLHGYLSHALDHAPLINRALREGYVVIAPELPGHGLSGGNRGGIDDFRTYGAFLDTVIKLIAGDAPRPWHVVGHSTGALAIFEYLRDNTAGTDPFEAVILVAPLIRSWAYGAARFGRFITSPVIDTVLTRYDSPLGVPQMPLSWFDAQVEWNRELQRNAETEPPVLRELLVLQGNRDTVVAWRYNRKIIRQVFPLAEYQMISGGTHTMLQEETPRQDEVLDRIIRYVGGTVE